MDGDPDDSDEPSVLERVTTSRGELVLRRAGRHLEIVSNGVFLIDTRDGSSEKALVREALASYPAPGTILIGGLGVGFSLVEAVGHSDLASIVVVELEADVVSWHGSHLAYVTAAALSDPRVEVVVGDVVDHLAGHPSRYDVICLDVDNGPAWTVADCNARLYGAAGLDLVRRALTPGGVLGVWSANRVPAFEDLLRRQLDDVRVVEVAVGLPRADPDVVYLAGRR
ncbi:MAG: spermidine synthase [Actinomycetes bacterium]